MPGVLGRLGTDGGGAIVSGADGRFNAVSCSESTSIFCGDGIDFGTAAGLLDGVGAVETCGGTDDDLDGCKDSSNDDCLANCLCTRSPSSGISSTDGCLCFFPLAAAAPLASPALSISLASTSTSPNSVSIFPSPTSVSVSLGSGLVAFGSSPARRAFAIRNAWYLANLILAATSGSGGLFHI